MEKQVVNITKVDGSYSVQPQYSAERTANYERQKVILTKWQATDKQEEESSGNVKADLVFDIDKQQFVFQASTLENFWERLRLSQVISSPLLLYRLICTFYNNPICENGYKLVWTYNLEHIASGKLLTFSEWKGSAGFWLPEYRHTDLPEEFKNDLLELLNYLVSNECAHPYDGVCAGSVA